MGEFQFVYIPHDASHPLEQWTEIAEKDREVECLLDRLKQHFLTLHPKMTKSQKTDRKEDLRKQKGIKQKGKIPEQLLEAASTMQLVESIALLPCMKQQGHIGVTMYVDDSGSFKQLPVNVRATDIALRCGVPDTRVLGDAFIGRVKENDEEFERMDFVVSEVSSCARWMIDAQRHYKEKRNQPAAEDIIKRMQQESGRIEEITPAEEERKRGNGAYKAGDYEKAIEAYSVWLEHESQSAVAYSNRAMAYLQLGRCEEALADSDHALELDSTLVKALYRRGVALEGLNRQTEAMAVFRSVLELQPKNKSAAAKLNALDAS